MATTIASLKGRFGDINYYIGTMPARNLVSSVRPAEELDTWAKWGIEERMQRDIDEKRVREELVPYLTRNADRFFGSIIVLVSKPHVFTWEPVTDMVKLNAAYKSVAEKMGFLTLDGGELIVLDGQHRLVAMRSAIQGKKEALDGPYVKDIPNDEVSVIFVLFDSVEKTRRIFNKVNRYAKPTSRADNIITSEDDGYAIIARRLMRNGAPLGLEYDEKGKREMIVDWRNNSITGRSQKFSTISVLHETSKDILDYHGIKDFDEKKRVHRPTNDELDRAYDLTAEWWEKILEGIEPYKELMDSLEGGRQVNCAEQRADDNKWSLLFKPAGQIALVRGIIRAVDRGLGRETAIERANRVDWRTNSGIWLGTIVGTGGRMSTGKQSYDLAAELIAYLIGGDRMTKEQVEAFRIRYLEARRTDGDTDWANEPLPDRVK
jgi:DNA sulfur modification protein DndB